jgi:O-antigen/teichoic acid export membrane protein
MGIIQQQSIRQSIVNYLGIAIGMVNVLYVYPLTLQSDELGIYQFFIGTASMLLPFTLLGSSGLVVKMFPQFKDAKNGHNGLLFSGLLLTTIGISIVTSLLIILKNPILDFYGSKSPLYARYYMAFITMLLPFAYASLLTSFTANFKRIAVPAIFTNLYIKIGMALCCWLYFYHIIDFDGVMWGLVLIHFLMLGSLVAYLCHLGEWHWRPSTQRTSSPGMGREMASYAFYSFIMGTGSYLAFFIDVFMVGTLSDLGTTATFTIAVVIANVVDTPRKAIYSIAQPIVAESWVREDLAHLKDLYLKSALNLLIITSFIYVGVTASVGDLFLWMPNGERYMAGVGVVFILGAARVLDALTGINDHLINLTKYYRFGFYSILFLAVLNVCSNLVLVPRFGATGAALATFFSLFLYNTVKMFFIYKKMGLLPFSRGMAPVLGIAALAFAVAKILPSTGHPLLDVAAKSMAVCLVFLPLTFGLKISKEFNSFLIDNLLKIKKMLGA